MDLQYKCRISSLIFAHPHFNRITTIFRRISFWNCLENLFQFVLFDRNEQQLNGKAQKLVQQCDEKTKIANSCQLSVEQSRKNGVAWMWNVTAYKLISKYPLLIFINVYLSQQLLANRIAKCKPDYELNAKYTQSTAQYSTIQNSTA